MRLRATFVLLLAAAAAPAAAAPAPSPAECPSCHVVVFLLSGVRGDSLTPRRMPTLARLKARSTTFTSVITPASASLPALATALTGVPPRRHGLINQLTFRDDPYAAKRISLSTAAPLLSETLSAGGYRAGFFLAHSDVPPWLGLDRGFEAYRRGREVPSPRGLAAEAVEWAGRDAARPLLLVFATDAAQSPATAGLAAKEEFPFWKRLRMHAATETLFGLGEAERQVARRLHDRLLGEVDGQVRAVLEGVGRVVPSSRTVVLVASTNGFALGEHDDFGNERSVSDETVRVPALLALPGAPARVVSAPVRLADLPATLASVLGLGPRAGTWLGAARAADFLTDAYLVEDVHRSSLRTADGWKLVIEHETGRRRLFDLRSDPRETADLAARQPQRARALEARWSRARDAEAGAP